MNKNTETAKLYTAVFPAVAQAVKYADRLAEGRGDWAVNVVRKGRTVTFNIEVPAKYADSPHVNDYQLFLDALDLVGYFGSTQNRKATLNGVKAPISY